MRRRELPVWFIALPALFMLVLPASALLLQMFHGDAAWITGKTPNHLLGAFGFATLALEAWIAWEAFKAWPRARGVLECAVTAPENPSS